MAFSVCVRAAGIGPWRVLSQHAEYQSAVKTWWGWMQIIPTRHNDWIIEEMKEPYPEKLADEIIEGLKASERNGVVVLPEREPALKPGDQVHVIDGVLRGLSGLYQGQRSEGRVAVLLAALGSAVLPTANVELVR